MDNITLIKGAGLSDEWTIDYLSPNLMKLVYGSADIIIEAPIVSSVDKKFIQLEVDGRLLDLQAKAGSDHVGCVLYYTALNVTTREMRTVRLTYPAVRIFDAPPIVNEMRLIALKRITDIDGTLLPNAPSDGAYCFADVLANSKHKVLEEGHDGTDGTETENDSGS